MKTFRHTLLTLLIGLLWTGCQEIEEPVNTVPTVTTDKVEKYSANFAYLSGAVTSRAQCYFLLSTSADMNDALQKEAYPYYNEERNIWLCQTEISDLQPGTTYYVVLCATDGRSEVKGNVVEFTTIKEIRIANIRMTPCGNNESDESTDFTPEDAVGVFLTTMDGDKLTIQRPKNMETYYQAQQWNLPTQIIPNGVPRKLYAYYPYSKEMGDNYTIPVNIDEGKHYLFGNSEELTLNNPEAHITMKHALSRITFSITKSKESEMEEYITRARLYNNNSKAIFLGGWMNVFTGNIIPDYNYNDGIFRNCEFKPETEKAKTIEMLVIPTSFSDDEVVFEIVLGTHIIYASLPANNWEQGKHYNYPFEITVNGLKLGNVTVEGWENNDGGSININQ